MSNSIAVEEISNACLEIISSFYSIGQAQASIVIIMNVNDRWKLFPEALLLISTIVMSKKFLLIENQFQS